MERSMVAQGYLASAAGTVLAEFHFTQQEGRWYIIGLTIAGSPALPGLGSGAS